MKVSRQWARRGAWCDESVTPCRSQVAEYLIKMPQHDATNVLLALVPRQRTEVSPPPNPLLALI
eukprot:1190911-Prorocentrum_minimum.AAC.1